MFVIASFLGLFTQVFAVYTSLGLLCCCCCSLSGTVNGFLFVVFVFVIVGAVG